MRVGKPGMQRKHRHLHRKAQEQAPRKSTAVRTAEGERGIRRLKFKRIDAGSLAVLEVHARESEQQEHAAEQRVQKEFDCRVGAAWAAVNPDDEVHRNQNQIPEQVKQKQIQRDEYANDARFKQQDHRVVKLGADVRKHSSRRPQWPVVRSAWSAGRTGG